MASRHVVVRWRVALLQSPRASSSLMASRRVPTRRRRVAISIVRCERRLEHSYGASTDRARVKASFRGLVTNEATFPPALPALPGAPAHRLAAGTRPPTHSPCVWALARAQGMAYLPLAAPTEKRLCRQPPNRSPVARSRSISCAFESYLTWYCPEAFSPPPSSSSASSNASK